MGGIPVDRDKKTSVTEQMAEEFAKRQTFNLAITPEGTRKAAHSWKKGFYFIAVKANVPILLAYIDYKKKEVGITKHFQPTGDAEKDIKTIQGYYKGVTARHPQNFNEM